MTSDSASPETTTDSADLLAEAEQLIATLTAHPDPTVGIAATALLERIDAVHRTALAHLMGAIQSMAGEAFVNRLTGDPAIRLLLMSYDLLAVDRRTQAEEAIDAVRGHLHAHGIDVELIDVLGGVIAVRLHGVGAADGSYDGVVRDIDEALRAGLLGFQELEIRDGKGARPAPADSSFFPAASLRRAFRPVYRDVCRAEEIAPGTLRGVSVDGVPVLLVRVGDEFLAVRNACGESPLPLDYSTLEDAELRCSWHGCRYDVRTGRRLDRPEAAREEQLSVLPVRVSDGIVQVVVGTAPGTGA
ncbi:MAG: Rieske 2Fe-2S domain-containing protein [Gemmatimonadota bacterium]|nr:Rieske 2Fe-2S domain-containing protein [Gemmatimonadota bacterium]